MASSAIHRSCKRRLPVGAEAQTGGGVHFRVWAPRHRAVGVEFTDASNSTLPALALSAEKSGYFSGLSPEAGPGTRYGFRLDGDSKLYPDPASRRQPDGPHGLSEVVDPTAFAWTDARWPGAELRG